VIDQVSIYTPDGGLRDLRAAGIIQVYVMPLQGGELIADGVEIERHNFSSL
jgi:hypothetical protein